MNRKEKAKLILGKLKEEFPNVSTALNHNSALELLVATMLSAQCTDERVNQTTKTLFKKYPDVQSYAYAKQSELVEDISSISLRNNKAKNLIKTAQIVIEEHNGQIPDTLEDLIQLPGIGRKTANVVLGEWFKKPSGFVVDTHVKRCAYRMGLTDSKDVKVIEQDLMSIYPKEEWADTASRIIFHGRTTCPASRKKDQECSLGSFCKIRE